MDITPKLCENQNNEKVNRTLNVRERAAKEGYKAVQDRIKLIDKSFESVISNIIPTHDLSALYNAGKEFKLSYDDLKKFSGMSKYRKAHFMSENDINKMEQLYAVMEINKTQYKYMYTYNHKSFSELNKEYQKGIDLLFQARDVLIQSVFNHYGILNFIMRSGVFKDSQLIKAQLYNPLDKQQDLEPFDVWNVKKHQKTLKFEYLTQEELKKFSKEKIDYTHPSFSIEVDDYTVDYNY